MILTLDEKIYPVEAIINAAYAFLEKAFIYLDTGRDKSKITVSLKSKGAAGKQKEERLKNEFLNELLFASLRYYISKNNRKIREYVIGKALFTSPVSQDSGLLTTDNDLDYNEDPLGIAIPWEEKYGKDKKVKKTRI